MSSAAPRDAETGKNKGARPADGHLPLGTELGPYRLINELGTGGMGMLYVGEHKTIGRKMAIKILHPDLAKRADIVRRFFDEARSVNTINHEHIVEIFDFVANPAGLNYLVMELLEGSDLQQSRVMEGPYALKRTVAIIAQTASALGAAHAKGIVHRDIKPENVFLIQRAGQKDFVKLLDFGLAKLSETLKGGADRTRAGTVLGTPEYMSPEQALGAAIDARSDVYALGLLLHWMLTDRLPHESREVEELRAQRARGTPPLPPRTVSGDPIPMEIDAIVQRCLLPSPSKRFQSMAELEVALRGLQLLVRPSREELLLEPAPGATPSRGDDPTRAGRGPTERTQPATRFVDMSAQRAKAAALAKLHGHRLPRFAPPAPSTSTPTSPAVPNPALREANSTALPTQAPKHPPSPVSYAVPAEEPRRFEFPWLALAMILSLGALGYAFWKSKPLERPVLPEAPGSPYGASMMGSGMGTGSEAPPPRPPAAANPSPASAEGTHSPASHPPSPSPPAVPLTAPGAK